MKKQPHYFLIIFASFIIATSFSFFSSLAESSLTKTSPSQNKNSQSILRAKTMQEKKMLKQMEAFWEIPYPSGNALTNPDSTPKATSQGPSSPTPSQCSDSSEIKRKLREIVLKKIDFSDISLQDAIAEIRAQAYALDQQLPESNHQGVNILLDDPQNRNYQRPEINLTLHQLCLGEALYYLAQAANLELQLQPETILLVAPETTTSPYQTRYYHLPSEFLHTLFGDHQLCDEELSGPLRHYFIEEGIPFPAGSQIDYVAANNLLIVKNSHSALENLKELLPHQKELTIPQVTIETRFLEVNQTQLQELGLDWIISNKNSYLTHSQNSDGNSTTNNSASALASMTSLGTLEKLLTSSGSLPSAGLFALSGIFSQLQFEVLLRALEQLQGSNLLSAPKVTVNNGEQATIRIGEEFPYPTDYTPPQIPQSQGSGMNPVVPATATSFAKKHVGVTMHVTPYLTPDAQHISLKLTPEVVHFEGFVNYGNPIYTKAPILSGLGSLSSLTGFGENQLVIGTAPILLTENQINQPIFSHCQVATEVSLQNNQTLLLGGLIREEISKNSSQIPLLGNIPLLGKAFQSHTQRKVKHNLLIFVTIHIS